MQIEINDIVMYAGEEHKVYGKSANGDLFIKPVFNIFNRSYHLVNPNEVRKTNGKTISENTET